MESMHYAAILRGISANIMYQGFRAMKKLPIDNVMASQYGGHFQYLTIQGLVLAVISMVLGMAASLFQSTSLKTMKRFVMMVAMPVAVVISFIYWSLLLLFPSLIIPAISNETSSLDSPPAPTLFYLPLHIDLSLHAVPAVSLILDFFLFEQKYNHREVHFVAPIAAGAFALWYGIWVEHCGKMNSGIFPYPFLTENNQGGRIAIYFGATLFSLLSFRLMNSLHRP